MSEDMTDESDTYFHVRFSKSEVELIKKAADLAEITSLTEFIEKSVIIKCGYDLRR